MANPGTFTKPILPLLIQNIQTYIGVLFSKNILLYSLSSGPRSEYLNVTKDT